MGKEIYTFTQDVSGTVYSFKSVGRTTIKKAVIFSDDGSGIYTLILTDLDTDNNPLPLTTRSRNGDMDKVLATVSAIIDYFMLIRPDAIVFIAGADVTRTYKYGKLLARDLRERKIYTVEGLNNDNTAEPIQEDVTYRGYFVIRQ